MFETTRYPCHGVHASLPKGKASGELSVNSSHLLFDIRGQQIELSLQELTMEQGGASDRLVFFSHPARPDWRFYTSDKAVLKDPHFRQYPQLAVAMRGARSKHLFNWSLLVAVLLICLAVPLLALINLDRASAVVAEQVPVAWETQLGESSFAQYRLGAELMDEEASERLLLPLVTPLLDVLPDKRFDYRFYIVNDSDLNAFALPGGIVVINSGLILAAENAEELIGVVGHEITHVRERHGIRNVISHAGTYVVISAVLGDASGVMAVVADAGPLLISQSYSRDFESEADRISHRLLTEAQIDPQGLASFFVRLQAKEQARLAEIEDEQTREWIETGFGLLSSHPATAERIDALQQLPRDGSVSYLDLSLPFAELKQQVGEFVLLHGVDDSEEVLVEQDDSVAESAP